MNVMRDILDSLRQAPAVLGGLVKSIPEGRLTLRRGDGFWSISEHVSHLAQVQPMLLERLRRFRDESRPSFVPYDPAEDETEPAPLIPTGSALAQFSRIRTAQLDLLENWDATIWSKEADHPEYERYTGLILVRHILMHDYWHMYRMEELWLTRDAFLTRLEG
jgi:uncharacterized damage-inducible protein DinB